MQTTFIPLPSPRLGSGGARDDQVRGTWLGGVRLGVTRAQPPVPSPLARLSRGEGVAVRPDTELWGSLRLVRP